MQAHQIKAPDQALVYMTYCTLATVCSMAMLKRKSKSEYERQISIAQKGCDWLQFWGIDAKGTRAEKIVGKQTVKEWAAEYENR